MPARSWLLSAPICLHADLSYLLLLHTQHCSTIRQDYSQDKSNPFTSIWWSCRKAWGQGYSWLVEELVPHHNSILCRFCISTERKSLPRPPLDSWERSVAWNLLNTQAEHAQTHCNVHQIFYYTPVRFPGPTRGFQWDGEDCTVCFFTGLELLDLQCVRSRLATSYLTSCSVCRGLPFTCQLLNYSNDSCHV